MRVVLLSLLSCVWALAPQPLSLLHPDASGSTMLVDEVGLAFLQSLGDAPLAVVAVSGPARSGKSYFINNLASQGQTTSTHQSSGFTVGHTTNGVTKGIWVHSHVLNVTVGGVTTKVVFMDTEGFGAPGNLEAFDPKLCFLTTVFASVFLYNVDNVISMDNIRFLHTVASLNDVFMKSYNSPYPAPPVTWLVQNFEKDVSNLDPPNAEGYLNMLLNEKGVPGALQTQSSEGGGGQQLAAHNSVLAYIRRMFAAQDPPRIFTLPPPKRGARRLELPNIPYTQLDDEYREVMSTIQSVVMKRATPKLLGGTRLTGTLMAQLLPKLAVALNDINAVGPALVMHMAHALAKECFKQFQDAAVSLPLPVGPDSLTQALATARNESLTKFDDNCVGGPNATENEAYRGLLLSNITGEAEKTTTTNNALLVSACLGLLTDADVKLRQLLEYGGTDLTEFDDKIAAMTSEVSTKCIITSDCASSSSGCVISQMVAKYGLQVEYTREQFKKLAAAAVLPNLQLYVTLGSASLFLLSYLPFCAWMWVPGRTLLALLLFLMAYQSGLILTGLTSLCAASGFGEPARIHATLKWVIDSLATAYITAVPLIAYAYRATAVGYEHGLVFLEDTVGRSPSGYPILPVRLIVTSILSIIGLGVAWRVYRVCRRAK